MQVQRKELGMIETEGLGWISREDIEENTSDITETVQKIQN